MNYCAVKYHVIEDGPGCRTALFVSGCRHHCKGCFQPQTWSFSAGEPFDANIEEKIINSLKEPYTKGLTLLGGEPFEPENQKCLLPFLEKVRKEVPNKTIWSYTGYLFEDLLNENSFCHTDDTIKMLSLIDVLVDGEFIESEKNSLLTFRGSANQRIIDIKSSLEQNKTIQIKMDRRG